MSLKYQQYILQGVSRTFALTIPKLPRSINYIVANAYLLCRIIDTIEDDPKLTITEKQYFHDLFQQVVINNFDAKQFANELCVKISNKILPAELNLITNTHKIISITKDLNNIHKELISKCITTMSKGMPYFERQASLQGLLNIQELDNYCYYVAGVVGDMLTGLFCNYSPNIALHKEELLKLSRSFAQGLQMTNIFKDIWEDRQRGVCWLPQETFAKFGINLKSLSQYQYDSQFGEGLKYLIKLALSHLQNAMEYTLLIPPNETGIRKFCLWSIGLAIKTLNNIYNQPNFTNSKQIKVTRLEVIEIITKTSFIIKSNKLLKNWFEHQLL